MTSDEARVTVPLAAADAAAGTGTPAPPADVTARPAPGRVGRWAARVRFFGSWAAAAALLVSVLPRAVSVSWRGVLSVVGSVPWPAVIGLAVVWLAGLYVHSFVLTAAAPTLTRRRALTLNLTGSAVANVVPLGGAAGVELNRRMMRAWGFDGRAFTGYTFLTNLWDVGSKLLLPVVAAVVLVRAGVDLSLRLQTVSLAAGLGFVVLVAGAALALTSTRGAVAVGRTLETVVRRGLRLLGRDRPLDLTTSLLDVRSQCVGLVARGWLRMTVAMATYVATQAVLMQLCVHLTGVTNTAAEVFAAFAVERVLTVLPVTPGGVGVADLGLVGVLVAFGGDPARAAAAAVLYRAFVFAVEIPVGSGALGIWLVGQRRSARRAVSSAPTRHPVGPSSVRRVAHVSDVFLPRLGGIETHVDDLARHQRAAGLAVEVLTPPAGDPAGGGDASWVRRLPASGARRAVTDYDLVHAHVSLFSPYAIGVARAAIRAGIPVLITVHSMWAGVGGIFRLLALTGPRRWPVVWSAVSEAAADVLAGSLGRGDVAVLPNAVDVAAWRRHTTRSDARGTAAGAAPEPPTIISVMRLMPRKRPVQLVRIFATMQQLTGRDDVRLVIVGDGPLRGRLQRYVRRRGLSDRVRITGRLSRPQVGAELAAASVYVAPAPKESFGIAALEARCVGLPVVAMRGSGVAEFVRDRVDGILVRDDAEAAVALADLVLDPELRRRITTHNVRTAPSFDWSDALQRTSELYDAAAAAARRRRDVPAPVPASASAAEA